VARSNSDRARKDEPLQEAFCPFNFISSDFQDLFQAAVFILTPPSGKPLPKEDDRDRVMDWLRKTDLLRKLAKCQAKFDTKGPVGGEVDKAFRTAMTLRDCTVFLRLPNDRDYPIEARLGDLDLKSAGKVDYWRKTEQELIDGGWYTAKETDRQPMVCQYKRAASAATAS
jgi:inositol-pentakisphosphate 2-kinase